MTQEWIAVIGSPRRGENTEKLVDIITEQLRLKDDVNVTKRYLHKPQLSPCSNCDVCITSGECTIDDEISKILKTMKEVDGIILASPSYNYNVSAQMKVLLDRTLSLNDFTGPSWKSRISKETKAIVVGVCKGNNEDAMGYTTQAMKKVLNELDTDVLEVVEYFNTKQTPVGTDLEAIENIRKRIDSLNIID